ncbi:MAG TPA: glycosyltransferase family 39 protein [Isosphaeraceae bacterium]|nr:glycosyltransferase family 39 protein [Isosphaeraceae bacterium]
MNPKHALGILIAGSALVRLICASSLGLGNDEAYHYLYAIHPAPSYFDHPPMMAWVEMAGLALLGTGTAAAWALRIGFIALFAGSTAILARLTSRRYGARAGFLAALALNVTGYYGLAASMFALPDGPLLFFWLLTLDRLTVALDDADSRRLTPWIPVGLAWGGAMLSKYHAVFLPMGAALSVVLDRRMRQRWLFRPGPYLAVGVGLMVFSPVIVWNADHGWVSFLFQGGRAVGSWVPRPDYLVAALLGQAAYLFPWVWLPLVRILGRSCRTYATMPAGPERLWTCLAAVPWGAFSAVACFRPVLPHWGLIGLVSLFPVLGREWAQRIEVQARPWRRRLAVYAGLSITLAVLALLEFHTGFLQRGGGSRVGLLEGRRDPTLDLYGWDQVADRIRQLGLIDDPRTFVFTRYWYQSAQLAYALEEARPVLCYNAEDPRGFAYWSRPEDWVGRDGILVLIGSEAELVAHLFGRWFDRVENVAEFWVERSGKPVRHVRLYRCTNQRLAFPFGPDRAERITSR